MSRALPAWYLLFSLVFLFACNEDDPTTIGSDFLGGDANPAIQFTDDLKINASLVRIDSVESGRLLVSDPADVIRPYIVGAIDEDPVFGRSFAGAYMQMAPAQMIVGDDDDDLVFDSLYLFLSYVNIEAYGDTSSLQNWVVYEMAEQMDSMRSFSNENFQIIETQELGRITDFKLETTEPFGPDSLSSRVQIDLSDSDLGERFLDVLKNPLDSTFYYNDQFKEFFKGIYIAPDTTMSNNAMATINIVEDASRILLHYSDLSIADVDSRGQTLNFIAGRDTCHSLNHFKHNYGAASDPSISQILATADKSLDEFAYLQGNAGLQVELEFPDFGDLGNIIINKAELVLSTLGGMANQDSIYLPPINIDYRSPASSIFEGFVEDEDLFFVNDYEITTVATVEELDTLNTTVTKYTFNLNGFFQDLVDADPEDRKMRLSISNRDVIGRRITLLPDEYHMERVVFGGPDHPDDAFRMKVNLFYTVIP